MRTIWRKRRRVTLVGPKQHLTLTEAVGYWLKKDATVRVKVYKRKGTGFLFVTEMALQDVVEMAQHMEESLRELNGGGVYSVRLLDVDSHSLGQYQFGIAGASKDGDAEPSLGGKGSKWEQLVFKLMEAKLVGPNDSSQIIEAMKALNEFKGGGIGEELVKVMANNFITDKENVFENVTQFVTAAKSLMPEVRQEDPLTAIISGFGPVVGQMLMARSMQGGQPTAAQQAATQIEALPGPGEPAEGASESDAADHDPVDAYITILRERISAGAEPFELADMILTLSQLEAVWSFDDPHPTLKPLVSNRDPTKLPEAFGSFCEAIPELSTNPELGKRIGLALLARVMQLTGQARPPEPPAEGVTQTSPEEPTAEEAAPDHDEGAPPDDTDHTLSPEAEVHHAEIPATGGDSEEEPESRPTGEAPGL